MGVLSNMVGKGFIKSVTSQHGHLQFTVLASTSCVTLGKQVKCPRVK